MICCFSLCLYYLLSEKSITNKNHLSKNICASFSAMIPSHLCSFSMIIDWNDDSLVNLNGCLCAFLRWKKRHFENMEDFIPNKIIYLKRKYFYFKFNWSLESNKWILKLERFHICPNLSLCLTSTQSERQFLRSVRLCSCVSISSSDAFSSLEVCHL